MSEGVDFLQYIQMANCTDENGLCNCPSWVARRMCPNKDCHLFHRSRNCQNYVLGIPCTGACGQSHVQLVRDYHQAKHASLYTDEDADTLRKCNGEVATLVANSDKGKEEAEEEDMTYNKIHLIPGLFETPEDVEWMQIFVSLDMTRSRDQIVAVPKFLLACKDRWRTKVKLLELWFRLNGMNTWLSSQSNIEQGRIETFDHEYLHFSASRLKTVSWNAVTEPCEFKLNISTRPKLESIKELLQYNTCYMQNYDRLSQAGMLVISEDYETQRMMDEQRIINLEQEVHLKGTELENQLARNNCTVCMDAQRNAKLIPCNHVACCQACARRIEDCPICRKTTTGYELVYIS